MTWLLLATGCMPEPEPIEVFDALWEDFDTLYGGFEARGVDWDEAGARWRPEVDHGLFEALCGLLAELDDGHVHLAAPGREVFDANRIYRERPDDDHFDVPELPLDGVAYLHLPRIDGEALAIDEILEEHPGEPLILDLRHNRGGDFTWAFEALGRLTPVARPVFRSRTRSGPEHDDYDAWTTWWLEPRAPYDPRPVAVLTDAYTISAGERAVLALRQLPQVVHMGTTTNGSQATKISRTLPNGWTYSLPVQQIVQHDGQGFEGRGIPPDIVVEGDAGPGDPVLERALKILR